MARFADLTREKVETFLRAITNRGLSPRTRNAHLIAIRSFSRWLVDRELAGEDPTRGIDRAKEQPERTRRAMRPDESLRLIRNTICGNPWPERARRPTTGYARAVLYLVALETGFRKRELLSLRVADFRLDDEDGAWIRLDAANAKNAVEARQPIRKSVAGVLRAFLANRIPSSSVFGLSKWTETAKMLRADLEAAGVSAVESATGKVLDFHALRACFATRLDRGNTPLGVRMALTRHSTRGNLTLDRYTDVSESAMRKALECLPDLTEPFVTSAVAATGTDDSTCGPACGERAESELHSRACGRADRASRGARPTECRNADCRGRSPATRLRAKCCRRTTLIPLASSSRPAFSSRRSSAFEATSCSALARILRSRMRSSTRTRPRFAGGTIRSADTRWRGGSPLRGLVTTSTSSSTSSSTLVRRSRASTCPSMCRRRRSCFRRTFG